ncbi:MAG: P-loop domain-containing protein [Thermaceae bacterium]
MRRFSDLLDKVRALEGRPYPFYKDLKGLWTGEGFSLRFVHVQGDPFATPSVVEVWLSPGFHRIPPVFTRKEGRVALEDYLLRRFKALLQNLTRVEGMGHSGRVYVGVDSPAVLPRAGARYTEEGLYLRFRLGLPAFGRRIAGKEAEKLLKSLAHLLHELRYPLEGLEKHVQQVEDHVYIQERLGERGLVAFVGNGSLLPRESGVSQAPLPGALPFESPGRLEARFQTPHQGEVRGMGVPKGLTLITGGGFHGKTTLLEALVHGVYPHIPGDGREWVVTERSALRVQSEDGRSVAGVDLRPFVKNLPQGRSTAFFSTQDASGSTSLAAAILEGLEAGSRLLLLDEDTSATNLLVRDARMQALVERETLTPLLDRVGELKAMGVSLILVVGGVGDYLELADTVILMEEYRALDATEKAKKVAQDHPTGRRYGESTPFFLRDRAPLPQSFDPRRGRREKVKGRGLRELLFGEEVIDLSALDLLEDGQVRTLGSLLKRMREAADGRTSLRVLAERLARLEDPFLLEEAPEAVWVRPLELAAAVNRLRSLQVRFA